MKIFIIVLILCSAVMAEMPNTYDMKMCDMGWLYTRLVRYQADSASLSNSHFSLTDTFAVDFLTKFHYRKDFKFLTLYCPSIELHNSYNLLVYGNNSCYLFDSSDIMESAKIVSKEEHWNFQRSFVDISEDSVKILRNSLLLTRVVFTLEFPYINVGGYVGVDPVIFIKIREIIMYNNKSEQTLFRESIK